MYESKQKKRQIEEKLDQAKLLSDEGSFREGELVGGI